MPEGTSAEISASLERGREPAKDRLFAALYAELRRLAERELQRHAALALSPTTLVHEVYVNLAEREGLSFHDHKRFLAYAARAMRGLIIDFARCRQAIKRGAGFEITSMNTQAGAEVADAQELARLSDALDERLAEVVDLRYFCGLSFAEIAALRGASERTVQRDWGKARLMLFHELGESGP